MAANSAFIRQPLTGIEGISAVLRGLPQDLQNEILGTALSEAAKPIVKGAKTFAPRRTGALRNSITHLVRKYKGGTVQVAIIGPDNGYYGKGKRLKNGADRRGADRPSKYAHLVEFGHHKARPKLNALTTFSQATVVRGRGTTLRKGTAVSVGWVPAQPFLRPAVLAAASTTGQTLAEGISKGIEKARAKRVKKGTHAA